MTQQLTQKIGIWAMKPACNAVHAAMIIISIAYAEIKK